VPVGSSRRCYSCDKIGHFAKDCPGITKKGGDSNPGGRAVDGVQESHPKSKISAVTLHSRENLQYLVM